MTKKRAKQFFDKIRQEMPEKGDFPVIVNEFKDDKTGSEYRLFITPSHIKGEENIRRLSLGYKIPDTGYMRSVQILKGTKVDILDYIGNEGNLGQIEAYIKMLKESSDN